MLEFRKYPPPPPEETEPPVCVVTYPTACDRPACGEVWALPFCEAHGREAEIAAKNEAEEDARREREALLSAVGAGVVRNPLLRSALGGVVFPAGAPGEEHDEAIRTAYALRESDTDTDTLRYDYGDATARDTPFDWWCEAREMVCGFMRQAYEAGQRPLLEALEPIRERATVQQELALRDMERRYVEPRRAARRGE